EGPGPRHLRARRPRGGDQLTAAAPAAIVPAPAPPAAKDSQPKPRMPCNRAIALLSCLAGVPLAAQRADVSIPASADATLYEDPTGSLSNGAGTGLFVGLTAAGQKRRALLQFDVASAVPPGATIVFAQLQLTIAQTTQPALVHADLHRVSQA